MADPVAARPPAGAIASSGAAGRRDALLRIARDPETDPAVLQLVAQEPDADEAVRQALIRNPRTPGAALVQVALEARLPALRELAAQAARIQAHPGIAQAILGNPESDEGLRAALGRFERGAAAPPAAPQAPAASPAPAESDLRREEEAAARSSQAENAAARREHLLRIAQNPGTDPEVFRLVVQQAGADDEILLALARNPSAPDEALVHVALVGSQAAVQALAAQAERIKAHPAIGQAILKDPNLEKGLRAAVAGLLREAGAVPEAAVATPFGRDNLLLIARNPRADAAALNIVAREMWADEEVLLALARNPNAAEHTLTYIAMVCTVPVLAELAGQAERLRANPAMGQAILENPEAGDALRTKVRAALQGTDATRKTPLYNLIKGMSTGQRLALAMKGNKEVRAILVKDSNEVVALEVIYSPRITETEILLIAQMRDVNENVLRAIAGSKLYRGKKAIAWALLNNPRTPQGLAMSLGMGNLSEKELDLLSKNRNISTAVQRAARSALEKKRRRGGGHGH
jgi:hypothetical protein